MRLSKSFYTREDVVQVARDLLGKVLISEIGGRRCSGMIVETEAYRGPDDKACHAWLNKRTERTGVMYLDGGHIYVYLCYGIHHLFNVVTAGAEMPHAILIRAIQPLENTELMLVRRNMVQIAPRLTAGPGSMSKAMGITTQLSGGSLLDTASPVWIEDCGHTIAAESIVAGPRIGVDYAGECALWPWRFYVRDCKWVSRSR